MGQRCDIMGDQTEVMAPVNCSEGGEQRSCREAEPGTDGEAAFCRD
jgi:hypothetical protein